MIIPMHSSYNDVIAVAALAVVVGFIAAVIAGDSSPTFAIAVIAFLLTGAFSFFRLWRKSRTSAPPLG